MISIVTVVFSGELHLFEANLCRLWAGRRWTCFVEKQNAL